jgi:DNA invertase Pin-like site-specific DNA recombinase
MAELERDVIRERVHAGLRRARAQGKRIGRPGAKADIPTVRQLHAEGRSIRSIANATGVSKSAIHRLIVNEGVVPKGLSKSAV